MKLSKKIIGLLPLLFLLGCDNKLKEDLGFQRRRSKIEEVIQELKKDR